MLLVVRDIDAYVGRASASYDRAMRRGRTKALTVIECLVKGILQSVSESAVLMAIWVHCLYPDLVVPSGANATRHFKDPLVPFGVRLTPGPQL